MNQPGRKVRGFIEHELTEQEHDNLTLAQRELIKRHAIPLPSTSPTVMKFKMLPHYFNQLFPRTK
jgi:hypothetical protein